MAALLQAIVSRAIVSLAIVLGLCARLQSPRSNRRPYLLRASHYGERGRKNRDC